MFGLSPSDLETIQSTFQKFPEIDQAILFGSRAMDKSETGSDIDIAIKGKNTEKVLASIKTILNEETNIPFFFDILHYNSITNQALKNHIKRVGKIIY